MKVAFAGTPAFARIALERIAAAGFEIALVLTQPDRPAGRGLRLQASPVKALAAAHGWLLAQPRSLKLDGKFGEDAGAAAEALQAAAPDVLVVAAYGLILPQWLIDLPRLGCLNIHASLLPRWRGAAPIQRAIEAGDFETGVTIMQMDAGLDTGPMLLSARTSIAYGSADGVAPDTALTLQQRLAEIGASLVVDALRVAQAGDLAPQPQSEAGASYARKIDKSETRLDWREDAEILVRRIHAFDPAPGAFGLVEGHPVKFWAAEVAPPQSSGARARELPGGTVLLATSAGVDVVAGSSGSILRATELQRAGGKRLAAGPFLRGFPLEAGQRFAL
ncbi:MAG: methionyl-tRNA formyltransferase [Variovorax sp.]